MQLTGCATGHGHCEPIPACRGSSAPAGLPSASTPARRHASTLWHGAAIRHHRWPLHRRPSNAPDGYRRNCSARCDGPHTRPCTCLHTCLHAFGSRATGGGRRRPVAAVPARRAASATPVASCSGRPRRPRDPRRRPASIARCAQHGRLAASRGGPSAAVRACRGPSSQPTALVLVPRGRACVRACVRVRVRVRVRACARACARACVRAFVRLCVYACTGCPPTCSGTAVTTWCAPLRAPICASAPAPTQIHRLLCRRVLSAERAARGCARWSGILSCHGSAGLGCHGSGRHARGGRG